MAWRIGVDSGGTFTDICLFDDATARLEVWKVVSTPDDPSAGIEAGVVEATDRLGITPDQIAYFGHGTTVATNTVIQGTGARTGLITTQGFRDLLEIARQKRPDLYDLQIDKPPALVSRDLRFEVPERARHDGTIETPLDAAAFRAAVRQLRNAGVRAVAVCFLYSFIRPDHEAEAAGILTDEFPEAFASISHLVAPEFREYERLSTTVINATIGPVMQGYITRLRDRLMAWGLCVPPHLTQSNGGVIGFDQAARLPVRTLLSGPSTGVIAAQAIGRLAGFSNLISFDMGGTSTDVSLLQDGQARLAAEATIQGYPIKAPMLDIHTVGAGGGSIAWIDSGGLLKIGPRSAGADPGPVCYARGNTEPTVTDANVVLGTLNPEYLLGGRMPIRCDRAQQAIAGLAGSLGLDTMAAAQGIVSVVTANMARAIRVISVRRGHDPRDYTLVAFGGAGPLHAARLAQELEIGRILVPPAPGILCAAGLLLTDLRADFAVTRLVALGPAALPGITAAFATLDTQAQYWFQAEGIAPAGRRIRRSIDMRYAGQNYEIAVPMPEGTPGPATLEALAAGFRAAHHRRYSFTADEDPMQLVSYRVEAVGLVAKATITQHPDAGPDAAPALIGRRQVWLAEAGGFVDCPIYDRARLNTGNRIEGAAIVEQFDATTLLLPAMQARVDATHNLILEWS